MKVKPTMITCAVALCLAFASGATRADSQDTQGRYEQQSNQNRSQVRQTIRGSIDSVRQANWVSQSGQREQRCIIRLRLENGRTEFVDVGSQAKLRDLSLNSGDQIQLKGQYQTVSGRRVFMADQIRVNGETFAVQRNQGRQQNQFAQSRTQQSGSSMRTVQGRIQGFRHVYLRPTQGSREQHSLIRLQLQDGRTMVVDLGRKKDLDDLGLQKGDRITLRGRQGAIDGRSVFFADQVRVGDQSVRIARSGSGRGQSQASLGSSSSQQSQQFTLRGKVAGYQVITLQSGQKQVSLLNLALEDGRSVLIDAGNKAAELDLKDLDLRDQAVIKGHSKRIQGRQVLVADDIQFLSPEQQSQQGAMGRSGQEQQSSGGGASRGQSQSDQGSRSQSEQ